MVEIGMLRGDFTKISGSKAMGCRFFRRWVFMASMTAAIACSTSAFLGWLLEGESTGKMAGEEGAF